MQPNQLSQQALRKVSRHYSVPLRHVHVPLLINIFPVRCAAYHETHRHETALNAAFARPETVLASPLRG